MTALDGLRYTKLTLNNGSGAIPALGFGTLIPDPVATKNATKAALEAGFRAIDTAERYRTESRGEPDEIHDPFGYGSASCGVGSAIAVRDRFRRAQHSDT